MKNMYYKAAKRRIAAAMSIFMIGSLAACGTSEVKEITPDAGAMSEKEEDDIEDVLKDSLGIGSETDSDKDETVYVMADSSGSVKNVIVSEWLKNTDKSDVISDISNLDNIENVKGDETYTQTGDKLTWDAQGGDIYYQGTTDEESPVSVDVTYYLDGKKVDSSELVGKSGHVKIRYEYNNLSVDSDESILCRILSSWLQA